MVEQAVRRIAEETIARMPAGWTEVVLVSTAGPDGVSVFSPGQLPVGSGSRGWMLEELSRLAEGLRQARGWDSTTLELRCRPSGEYQLVAGMDTVTSRFSSDGFQAVLNPGYRLPQPGLEQEGGSAGPEGDPGLATARFGEYLERRAAILGGPEPLPPPASAAALDDAERRIGHSLPADLRALYLLADGDGTDYEYRYLFGGSAWLALEDLVSEHANLREPHWHGWGVAWDFVVLDADPPQTVRRCTGHPAWLPFGTGEDGNYLAVDLAPARNGSPGQVLRAGHDFADGPAYVASSVTSLLGHCLDLLRRGAFEVEDGDIQLELPWNPGSRMVTSEIPGEISPGVQAIYLSDAASPVDLARLAATPNLRALRLNRSVTADLTPLRALPVESVAVTLDGGDLAPLEGHRSLAALDLGTTAPVDIGPLRTAPKLRGLDLSRASVRDLTVLSSLPELRYLALTARQWGDLLDSGQAPPGLACADLVDTSLDEAPIKASFDEALIWAARLGLDIGEPFRISGAVSA